MKLIYIIAQGHSGSTLLDSILGTHPDFFSTGELRYLGWQLHRTTNKKGTVQAQDICSCNNDFKDCRIWSKVFESINLQTGINIIEEPRKFKINFFNQFGYGDRGPFHDRIKGYLVRRILEEGYPLNLLKYIDSDISNILKNNWLLYENILSVSKKKIVVDSSKHLTRGLLLQRSRPENVYFIFIHRSVHSLVGSSKRWKKKQKLKDIVKAKKLFEIRVNKYKNNISDLNYLDVDYEKFVNAPASFLESVAEKLKGTTDFNKQDNKQFLINPSKSHLVAGNPMRYRGQQLVRMDNRWKFELSKEEINKIDELMEQTTF